MRTSEPTRSGDRFIVEVERDGNPITGRVRDGNTDRPD
jgi:hypothetical protein